MLHSNRQRKTDKTKSIDPFFLSPGYQVLTQRIQQNPADATAYYNRGKMILFHFWMQPKTTIIIYKKALEDLNKAISLNPQIDANCYKDRADTCYQIFKMDDKLERTEQIKHLQQARKDYLACLHSNPLLIEASTTLREIEKTLTMIRRQTNSSTTEKYEDSSLPESTYAGLFTQLSPDALATAPSDSTYPGDFASIDTRKPSQ
jgi:tetratricopeptide (TPR) repeat protein